MSVEERPRATTHVVRGASADSIDDRWKDVTERANGAFGDKRFAEAAGLYQSAAREALAVFDGSSANQGLNAEHAVPMLIVSAANSARNHRELADLRAVENEFQAAAEVLVSALSDATGPSALRDACCRHLPMLLTEYRLQVRELGLDTAGFNECFHRSRTAALRYLKETQQTH